MRVRLSLLLLATLTALTHAQTTKPTTTYTLHAQPLPKNQSGWTYSVLAPKPESRLASDGSLIILLPQADKQWALKQITYWDTATPKEETLTFAGDLPDRNKNLFADLRLTPDDRYALIRLRTIPHAVGKVDRDDIESTVVVVDLKNFKIQSRVVTSDPLLLANWRFTENGLLLAVTSDKSHASFGIYDTHTSTHQAAILAPPTLTAGLLCTYTTDSVSVPRLIQKVRDANTSCATLIQAANIGSMEDLAFPKRLNSGKNVAPPPPPDCYGQRMSDDKRFALFDCYIEHNGGVADGMFAYRTAKSLKVLSVSDGSTVLKVPWHDYGNDATEYLVSKEGLDYLVILKDGITIEVFKLP